MKASSSLCGEVVTTGLATTRRGLVNKQLELKPGDPLSPSAMADTQRRLYDLGIFAQVDMAIQNPDGEEDSKYVLYDLRGSPPLFASRRGFGAEFARIGGSNAVTDLSDPGGAPGVSPRVSLDLTRLNFLGAGQSLSLQSRLSTLQKRAAVNYFVPARLQSAEIRRHVLDPLRRHARRADVPGEARGGFGADCAARLEGRSRSSTASTIATWAFRI